LYRAATASGFFLFTELLVGMHVIGTIRLLLASNPNTVNGQDKKGGTALYYAIRSHVRRGSKYSSSVKILSENRADASLQDRTGQTLLHCLCFQVLGSYPIDMGLIALLLAHGANVGDTDANSSTPLYLAARNLQSIEAVQFLLSYGADISTKNLKGSTPVT
jgi:ankyrin repeat protein